MIILSIRTDKPEAEIGLFDDKQQLAYEVWQAHRQLAETLHVKIKSLLESQSKDWQDIEGIVAYQGPGSFTGLRIGLTVANTLAASLQVPVVARQDPAWLQEAIDDIVEGSNDTVAIPEYGAPVHITKPKR